MFDVYVLPFALVVSAAVLIAAAVRRALHNAADATTPEAIQAAMNRHPSNRDRLDDMLIIRNNEDAWDRNVWPTAHERGQS